MANDLGTMRATLELESAAFIRELTRASTATSQATTKISASMSGLNKTFNTLADSAKHFILGLAGFEGLRLFKDIVEAADEVGESARRLGVAAEDLQRFRFAAEQAGVGIGAMDAALKLFQKNLAAGKFSAQGGTLIEQFTNFLQQIRNAPTQLQEVQLATAAAGKQFTTLLALSRDPDFGKNIQQATVYTEEAISVAEKLGDEFRAVKEAVIVGFGDAILKGFNSGLALTDDQLKAIADSARNLGEKMTAFFKTTIREVQALASAGEFVVSEISKAAESASHATEMRLKARGLAPQTTATGAGGAGIGIGAQATGAFAFPEKPLGDSLEEMKKQIGEWKTTVQGAKIPETIKEWTNTFQDFGDTAARSFADAIVEGKKFSDVIGDLTKELEKAAISTAFHQVFALLIGHPLTPGSATTQATAGTGLIGALGLHGGGVVGRDGTQRFVPGSMFMGAPRLHSGLRSGEYPAILQSGEQVIPRGGGGPIQVNIINSGSPLEQQGPAKFDGRTMEVFVKNTVSRGLGSGDFDTSLGGRYGLAPGMRKR